MPAESNEHPESVELAISRLRAMVEEVVMECRQLDALYDAITANYGKRTPPANPRNGLQRLRMA